MPKCFYEMGFDVVWLDFGDRFACNYLDILWSTQTSWHHLQHSRPRDYHILYPVLLIFFEREYSNYLVDKSVKKTNNATHF